jgi:hypothetical protein
LWLLRILEDVMRFMVLIKATKESEAGVMPSMEDVSEMMKFNEELANSGIMLGGDGLHPSSKGARIQFSGKKRTVLDGPFAETKELIAGYWIWQVRSKEEAIEWARRIPNPTGQEGCVELRQVFDPADFGPEIAQKEEALMKQIDEQIEKNKRGA